MKGRTRPKGAGPPGFSIVELLIVLSVATVLASVAVPAIQTSLIHFRADVGQQTVLMQFNLARSLAVEHRRVHRLTVFPEGAVALARIEGGNAVELSSIDLPRDVAFRVESGVPTQGERAPDGIGATEAISLNQGSVAFFRPDGSVVDPAGRHCSGVVHLSVEGYPTTARAVTVFGPTGRIRGWRYAAGRGEGEWK